MRVSLVLILTSLTACSLDWSNGPDEPPIDGGVVNGDGSPGDVDASVELPEDGSEDGCNDGFEVSGTTCVDIDECATDNGGCTQTCENRAGDFVCACEPGYTLEGDGVTCAPFAWSEPALLELRDDSARTPAIAVDSQGRATVLWSLGFGGIWSNRYVPGEGWQGALEVDAQNGTSSRPVLGITGSDDVLALWDTSDAEGGVWWSRRTPTGAWDAPAQLDPAAYGAALVMQGDEASALWLRSDGMRGQLAGSRYKKGSGWRTPQAVDVGTSTAVSAPRVAVDSAGVAHATWANITEGQPRSLWRNQDDIVGTWGAPVVLDDGTTPTLEDGALLTALPDGSVLAAWSRVGASGTYSAVRGRYVPGMGFVGGFAFNGVVEGRVSALTSDASGRAFVVGESPRGVWAARNRNGEWERAVIISDVGQEAQVAMDGHGNAIAVFRVDGDLWSSLYRARIQQWSAAERIEHIDVGSSLASSHRVALDTDGHAFVTWIQVQDRRNVWVTRLEACNDADGCSSAWPPACPLDGACVCPDGFMLDAQGKACIDVDECALGTDGCDSEPDACVNREGGYECICPEFLPGDGFGDLGCSGVMSPWD